MKPKKGKVMARKHEATNTIEPGPVTLTDSEVKTLDNIVKQWNLAKGPDVAEWDVKTALAELARLTVRTMHGDYGDEPRKPTFSAPPAPPAAGTPPATPGL